MPDAAKAPSYRILTKIAYLLSARWLREGLHAAFFICLARMSATTYGEFMLAMGIGSILLLMGEFGLNIPLVSMLTPKGADQQEALLQVSLIKSVLLGLGLLGALEFIHWQGYAGSLRQVILVLGVGAGLEALASTFFISLQVQGRQDLEGKVRALAAGLGFGYGLAMLALGAPPVVVAFFKLIETLVNLTGGIGLSIARAASRWRWPSLGQLRRTLQRGLLFAVIEITAVIFNRANLFFLQRYHGAAGVGQYSVIWQLVDGIANLVSSLLLQSIMFPLFVQLWHKDRPEVSRLAQNAARWLLCAALPLMFVLYAESDRLIPLIFGPQYQEAIWMQKYLVFTIVAAFLYNLAAFVMVSMEKQVLLLVFYLSGLICNLAWCALVIPGRPLLGATLAMVLTKGMVAALAVSYCQRRLGLIPIGPLKQLAAAALGGIALYLGAGVILPRLMAETLALTPILALAWQWWQQEKTSLKSEPGI